MHELSVDVEEDEGDFSVQATVFSQVDLPHATLAQLRDDLGEFRDRSTMQGLTPYG